MLPGHLQLQQGPRRQQQPRGGLRGSARCPRPAAAGSACGHPAHGAGGALAAGLCKERAANTKRLHSCSRAPAASGCTCPSSGCTSEQVSAQKTTRSGGFQVLPPLWRGVGGGKTAPARAGGGSLGFDTYCLSKGDAELRAPPRARALQRQEFLMATTKERATMTAPITAGANLAKCDLVLKGNTPSHACEIIKIAS